MPTRCNHRHSAHHALPKFVMPRHTLDSSFSWHTAHLFQPFCASIVSQRSCNLCHPRLTCSHGPYHTDWLEIHSSRKEVNELRALPATEKNQHPLQAEQRCIISISQGQQSLTEGTTPSSGLTMIGCLRRPEVTGCKQVSSNSLG